MSIDREQLRDAVTKMESDSATETEKDKAADVIEQHADELEDEKDLENLTTERLTKVFVKGEKLDVQAEPDKESTLSTPKDEESAEDEDTEDGPTPDEAKEEAKLEAEEKKGDEEVSDEKPETKDKDDKKVPPLSEAYYRAAIHAQWKPEDITKFYEVNPELALKTFGNIYESLNRSSKDFAAIGRAKKETVVKTKQQPDKEIQSKPEFKGIDMDKLRKQYPDDPIVDLVQTMQDQNKTLFEKMQTLETSRSAPTKDQPLASQSVMSREVAAVEQQIENFFVTDDMKLYKDFYGVLPKNARDWETLTPGQKMNRWAVVEMMDQIITGASVAGQNMQIDEALRRAHLSVTEPIREQVIREDIKSQVKKRSNALTLEPSNTAKSDFTKPKTQEDLETLTTERLAKLNW
jgi:hypothetical protein